MRAGVVFIQHRVGGFDRKFAAFRHGVPRIHGQVKNHLFNLPGIGFDQTDVWLKMRVQFDVFSEQTPAAGV